MILRVARPGDNLEAVRLFYEAELGLTLLAQCHDHLGLDGLILGHENSAYHLEFTHAHGHIVGRAATMDNLLVLYLPDQERWRAAVERMMRAGFNPVPSFNPYWDQHG